MSDVGEGDGLHTFLLRQNAEVAEQALLGWATALGRMHALTVGFESGMFRHAMMDASFARLNFPWCWYAARLPAHLPRAMETVYQAELVQGCPEAGDTPGFFHALTEGCAAQILLCSKWSPLSTLLREDITEEYATARQKMLFRLNTFVHMTQAYGRLEAMGATVEQIVISLRRRGPLEAQVMPYYPAFQTAE